MRSAKPEKEKTFRLLFPVVIKDFNKVLISYQNSVSFNGPVLQSAVFGQRGGNLSWNLVAHRDYANRIAFDLRLTGHAELRIGCRAIVSVRDLDGTVLSECPRTEGVITVKTPPKNGRDATPPKTGYYGTEKDSREVGLLGEVQQKWLFDGNLHVCVEAFLKVQWSMLLPSCDGSNDLLTSIKAELANPSCSDFALIGADGQQVKTHRMVLSAISPVFRAMFAADCQEMRDGYCKIEGAEAEGIKAMLACVCGANVNSMDIKLVKQMHHLASKYQINSLRDKCMLELATEINMANVLEVLVSADQDSDDILKLEAFVYLEDNLRQVTLDNMIDKLMCLRGKANQSLYEEFQDHMHLRRTGLPRTPGL